MTQELITQLETVITELSADVTKFDEKGNKVN